MNTLSLEKPTLPTSQLKNNNLTTISIHQLGISCIIGAYPEERHHPQTLFVDIEIQAMIPDASIHDSLDLTIDYDELAKLSEKIAVNGKFFLVETLAETIATEFLKNNAIKKTRITVHKPTAIPKAKNVSVSVERISV